MQNAFTFLGDVGGFRLLYLSLLEGIYYNYFNLATLKGPDDTENLVKFNRKQGFASKGAVLRYWEENMWAEREPKINSDHAIFW